MTDFNNVKLIIKDKHNHYLVGRKYDTDFNFSSIGGHKELHETIYETMAREFNEETSKVLEIVFEDNKIYFADDVHLYPVQMKKMFKKGKQIYIVLQLNVDLRKYIGKWRNQFITNQQNLVMKEISSLHKRFPSISEFKWLEYVLRFKNDWTNTKFNNLLSNHGFTKTKINELIQELKELGYYLEMDNLELVSAQDLKSSNGIYERDILNI